MRTGEGQCQTQLNTSELLPQVKTLPLAFATARDCPLLSWVNDAPSLLPQPEHKGDTQGSYKLFMWATYHFAKISTYKQMGCSVILHWNISQLPITRWKSWLAERQKVAHLRACRYNPVIVFMGDEGGREITCNTAKGGGVKSKHVKHSTRCTY